MDLTPSPTVVGKQKLHPYIVSTSMQVSADAKCRTVRLRQTNRTTCGKQRWTLDVQEICYGRTMLTTLGTVDVPRWKSRKNPLSSDFETRFQRELITLVFGDTWTTLKDRKPSVDSEPKNSSIHSAVSIEVRHMTDMHWAMSYTALCVCGAHASRGIKKLPATTTNSDM